MSDPSGRFRTGSYVLSGPLPLQGLPVELDLPCEVSALPPVRAVRGTVILSSIHALRELELFEAYRAQLPEQLAPSILQAVPGTWLPLELARTHYVACQSLHLSPNLEMEVGLRSGKKSIGAMLGTAVRLSRVAGATPWTLIRGGDRVWNRAYDGGAMRIYRVGESEAFVETHKNPLMVELEFCRNSFRGFCLALYGLVSERMSFRVFNVLNDVVQYRVLWK